MSAENTKKSNQTVDTCSEASELYLDTIGMEALERAGNCPQLKGIAHELLYRDKLNMSADGLIKGNLTRQGIPGRTALIW